MADFGNVQAKLNGISDDGLKRILLDVFEYILRDIRFGRAVAGDASKNFGAGFFAGTTPAVANTEFSIQHTFGRTPYLCMQVLPLNQVNAKIVRLEIARAADTQRVYLKSPETGAAFFLYIEG